MSRQSWSVLVLLMCVLGEKTCTSSSTAATKTPADQTTSTTAVLDTTTAAPTTAAPTTAAPITTEASTTTAAPTTAAPTTASQTTAAPTTTTAAPTTAAQTPAAPTTTTAAPTTTAPTTPTAAPTTAAPTTAAPTTAAPTTITAAPTTAVPTTAAPTTAALSTAAPTTITAAPTTAAPSTAAPTTTTTVADSTVTSTVCSNNTFGTQCAQRCDCVVDNTLEPTQACDPVDGACQCSSGWTGTRCQLDIDECLADPCSGRANEGCHNYAGGYNCSCVLNYVRDENNDCVPVTERTTTQGPVAGFVDIVVFVRLDISIPPNYDLTVIPTNNQFKVYAYQGFEAFFRSYMNKVNRHFDSLSILSVTAGSLNVTLKARITASKASKQAFADGIYYLSTSETIDIDGDPCRALDIAVGGSTVDMTHVDQGVIKCLAYLAVNGPCAANYGCVLVDFKPLCLLSETPTPTTTPTPADVCPVGCTAISVAPVPTEKQACSNSVIAVLATGWGIVLMLLLIGLFFYIRTHQARHSALKKHHPPEGQTYDNFQMTRTSSSSPVFTSQPDDEENTRRLSYPSLERTKAEHGNLYERPGRRSSHPSDDYLTRSGY